MSAFPPKGDISRTSYHVRFVPKADIAHYSAPRAQTLARISCGAQHPLRMAAQQAAPVAIAAAEMAAAERGLRAVIELILAAAMVGTVRPSGEIFVAAMVAKARWQLPQILPVDGNDHVMSDSHVNYSVSHPSRARGLRRKQKQTERCRDAPHETSATIGDSAEYDASNVDAARGSRTVKREPSPSLLCTSIVP